MGVRGDEPSAPHDYPIHWYVVVGIVGGVVAFLVGMTVCAFRCYNKRASSSSASNRLSSAIKKGLKEAGSSGVKNSPSLRSTASAKSSQSKGSAGQGGGGGGGSSRHLLDSESPTGGQERRVSRSPTGGSLQGGADQPKDMVYLENEEKETGARSPGAEKADSIKEKSEDDVKKITLGNLQFTVDYDSQKTALMVTILKACDLPAKDPNLGSSDPYVKLQLLPEKRHKVKTRVLRKTLNPVYDEIFTFYGIDANQIPETTLHFVVLSFDRFSRDDIIGEVIYPLAGAELGQKEMTICRDISPRHIKMHSQGRGELLVSLCYQPAANRLTVVILKARNLPKMDITGLSDPYVKIYLSYNGQRIAKKKTHVKKRTLNPVFNESFLFDVPCNEGLQNIGLEFLALDWDRMTKNEVIGRLQVGAKLGGAEAHHWNEVMNCPRKQIAEWHKLKE